MVSDKCVQGARVQGARVQGIWVVQEGRVKEPPKAEIVYRHLSMSYNLIAKLL